LALTVATFLLLLVQVTFLLLALDGEIIADNCLLAFTLIVAFVTFIFTPVTV
jgi:hypothetical protein